MPLAKCIEQESYGHLSLKDCGCCLTIKNETKQCLIKVKIDNCLPINGLQCDYAIINKGINHAVMIELKGSDVSQAIKQIDNSIIWFTKNTNYLIRYCIIVLSGRHPKETAHLLNQKEKLKNKHRVILKILKSGVYVPMKLIF